MRFRWILLGCMVALLVVALAFAAADKQGSPVIQITAGSQGDVTLPHQTHQTTLNDCKVCHDVFPQEPGSINRLKKEDKIKSKQVMNTVCLKCHREYKEQNKKTGPVSCGECHKK